MRKNSPRKWLHAILDLLPCILIPVFMIYSHRHTIDSYSVTRQERENLPYNFYQGIYNGKPTSTENWADMSFGNDLEFADNEYLTYSVNIEGTLYVYGDLDIQENNVIYFSVTTLNNSSASIDFDVTIVTNLEYEYYPIESERLQINVLEKHSGTITYGENLNDKLDYLNLYFYDNNEDTFFIILSDVQVFNLTTIFGSGNEPTKEEFERMLTQDYYNYGDNYVDNYVVVSKTYNDTDIMSQFTYNLYNSVDKYFNMNNVFGMNNVYTWFESNIFHGTAPLYIYIVWNIVLYEFVMDLLMLLYSLFMWFIDMCQNLIERTYCSSKGGK